jgi:transcriptional regulator with XRE-family HTH domain
MYLSIERKAPMLAHPVAASEPRDGVIVSKAAIRAAERLGVSQRDLGTIIGVSESTVSRMKTGDFPLDRDPKAFELSLLFIRLYRSLDAIVGGDAKAAASWLKSYNTALETRPIEAVQTITGLLNVIEYLDSRRAPV